MERGTRNYFGQIPTSTTQAVTRVEVSPTQAIPGTQIPATAKTIRATLSGAGGGSGSGARGATNANRQGGSTGSAGLWTVCEYDLDLLAASLGMVRSDMYYLATTGLAGTPGGAIATDNTDGQNGSSGGTSILRIRNASGSINKVVAQAAGGASGQGGRRAAAVSLAGGSVAGPGDWLGAAGVPGVSGGGLTGNGANVSAGAGGGGAGGGAGVTLQGNDIGTGLTPGSFSSTATTYSFNGGAGGLVNWASGASDNFYFMSAPDNSTDIDWTMTRTVTSVGANGAFGIMMRDGLAANAPFFAAYEVGGTFRASSRDTAGGTATTSANTGAVTINQIRLSKTGNVYVAYYLNASSVWTPVVSLLLPAFATPRIGFFMTNIAAPASAVVGTLTSLQLSANGGSASASGLGRYGLLSTSTAPSTNAAIPIQGLPGAGGGGGAYLPVGAGGTLKNGGAGARGASGGGGGASDNGFTSGAAGASGNGYVYVELFG